MLTVRYATVQNNVQMIGGNFYSFKYANFQNDPTPVFLYMYSFSGTHPNTGNRWNFHQGLNFSYIPRAKRKSFIKSWLTMYKNSKTVRSTFLDPSQIDKLDNILVDTGLDFSGIIVPKENEFGRTVKLNINSIHFEWKDFKNVEQMNGSIRRYIYRPNYITGISWIPPYLAEEMVVTTWQKDFSKKIRKDLLFKYNILASKTMKKAMQNAKKKKK